MQIREKGRKVICIKTEYSPEKKRTFGKTVASQDIGLSTVSEYVSQQLSKEEVDELQNWLTKREETKEVDSHKIKLSISHITIPKIADALDAGYRFESEEKAQATMEAVDRLNKSLRKAGYKRTKNKSKEKAIMIDATTGEEAYEG